MVSRKISLFGKIQRGSSPSFEFFQLDMYAYMLHEEKFSYFLLAKKKIGRFHSTMVFFYSLLKHNHFYFDRVMWCKTN